MKNKAVLSVALHDVAGRVVSDAKVELRGAYGEVSLPFDKHRGAFVSEPVEPGDYTVGVLAQGYAPQDVALQLRAPGLSTSLSLGQEEQPYYVVQGRRVYFNPEDSRAEAPAQERGLPIVERASSATRFLTPFIEVIVADDVTQERLEEVIRPFGLHVHSQDTVDPRIFRVESDGVPGPELGAVPERLAELPEVRSATSIITAIDVNTQLVPPQDTLFPLQFYAFVTRTNEAWVSVDSSRVAQSFGSADVIVAVSDSGIVTTAVRPPVAGHTEFSGVVVGGAARPGLDDRKLVFAFDFNAGPAAVPPQLRMSPGPFTPTDYHGSAVSGVISAAADGAGVVGIAANTRLAAYVRFPITDDNRSADALAFCTGIDPVWRRGAPDYDPAEPFPFLLNTGGNPVPGPDIVNASHTFRGGVTARMQRSFQNMTLFGRRRRGVCFFASAGNVDNDVRGDGRWAENLNMMRVAGSTLDLNEEELRANFSCFSLAADPVIDFAAPTESQNGPRGQSEIPRTFPFVTTDLTPATTTSGFLETALSRRMNIASSPAAGTLAIVANPANPGDLGGFVTGNPVIVRDKTSFHAEFHRVANIVGTTVTLQRSLAFSYTAANGELIFPNASGPTGATFNFGGTSAASPVVAGVAALMLSVKPSLTWLEVREILRATAVPIALRYRGSRYATGPDHRYQWLDPNGTPLIDANGLLDITGGNKTIAARPAKGDRILTLSDTAGIEPRQALMIGAETTLNGAHPKAPPLAREIDVQRAGEFEVGDTIFIGRDVETVLLFNTAIGDTVVRVQSVDGIEPGDSITIGADTRIVASIARMSALPPVGMAAQTDAETVINLTTPLAAPHTRPASVRLAGVEGPFNVTGKSGATLTLNNPVIGPHPNGRMVRKRGTELRAVIRVQPGNRVEIDRLQFDHPLNSAGVEHVRIGRIASYNLGLGRGRIDAKEAVDAAKSYTHDLRDLVIRNFLADDGVTNVAAQEVESPDLWVRNENLAVAADYATPPPHQTPEITVDPAIHIGTGRNDLEVSGTCTSTTEVTFTIEIDHTAADTFHWRKNDEAPTTAVAVTGAAQALSDGVSIRFASTTDHTLGDRWIIRARQIANRRLDMRYRNRGTLPWFTQSIETTPSSPNSADVARARLLLCVSDGTPVCRFASVAAAPGPDDLQVVSRYVNATPINARALYTIEITVTAAGGDTFEWRRDGTLRATVALTATTLEQALDDGVRVRFGSHTGHSSGDRWNLFARHGDDAFLNIDHYWELDTGLPGAFDPVSGRTGTRPMAQVAISGLPAGDVAGVGVPWPEALRFATNNPNLPRPTLPRRLFVLGEAVPHDGALTGFTAKTNNNFSFREIVFAKTRFSTNGGADALQAQLDVDALGQPKTHPFRVEVRCTAGTFAAEKVRLRLTARKGAAPPEVRTFRFSGGTWGWDTTPTWATVAAPLEARRADGTQPAAAGEQFDIGFDCSLKVDKSFSDVAIEAQIVSDFRDLAVFTAKHNIAVFAIAPMPQGTGAAQAAALPKPSSFVFTETASLTQSAAQAFGPVAGSETTRYRTTSLFRAPVDVKAFSVVSGLVAVQRDPANDDAVNLILRPLNQPLSGFTAIKYFVYRGLRLTDFLKGTAGADAKLIRPQAGSSPLIDFVWTNFLRFNPGATDMPATVFGYDPDTQTAADSLDELFFQFGAAMQRPFVPEQLELGSFHAGGGSTDFGFEVVIEEGDFTHDLTYARRASNEIDVTGVPAGTAAERFALRIKQEEILNYLDPAVFYGLHMHDGGEVRTPTGSPGPLNGDGIFQEIVSKFATKHSLYLDVRSENGSSLNFYRNYDVGGGNQIQTGVVLGPLNPRPYATHGWPIVILDQSATINNPDAFNDFFLQLPRKDNEHPVLYVDHAIAGMTMTDGSFVRGDDLVLDAQWTKVLRFGYPNTGTPIARQGVAWIMRLFYGRLKNLTPVVPLPNTVLKALKYTDNVFGPIDRVPKWAGTAGIKWLTTQDNRYVDAGDEPGLNWRQMMRCGMAEQSGTTPRVLLYAFATARDTTEDVEFAPIRSITNGTSDKPSFFTEPGLFGVYQLEQDQISDAGTLVRTLQLRQRPEDGFSPASAMLVGLAKAELDALTARGVSISKHFRSLLLDDKQTFQDPGSGRSYDRYRVGVQGLNEQFGEYASDFPTDPIHIYSVDGQLFASKAFAEAEPLPTTYARNFEEGMGVRKWPQRERRIDSVIAGIRTINIASFDWRRELVPGLKLKIDKSVSQNGEYIVDSITFNGTDTAIVLSGGTLNATAPVGSAFSPERFVEDIFIDLDQDAAVAGIPKSRTLVDTFVADLAAIPNDASAKAAIQAKINDAAPKLLNRARARAVANRALAEDHERTLYWARQRMRIALESHPFSLASISGRNELLQLFEQKSRGYDLTFSGAPGGVTRKILITGFDPFQLDLDIETSNPSAATALAFHGQTIASSGKTAYCEAAIFPVRYRDFDSGVVEALVNPRLAGAGRVDLIVTISQNGGSKFFDVERLAGRRRSGFPDNDHVTFGPRQIGDNATHAAFYETNLPVVPFVTGPFGQGPFQTPPDDDQRVFFDQSFQSANPPQSFPNGSSPTAPPGANANTPAYALNTITGEAVEGSGGSYLSNEIFYRVAQRRVALSSTTLTGHVHVPSPKVAKMDIAEVIGEVENMIKRFLDSLP
jgi:pyrrolidone-carboxylate peptidase